MKLARYLAENRVRQSDFADLIGISQSQVSRLAKGELKPSFDILEKIERVTGGAVSFTDFKSVMGSGASEPEAVLA